MPADNCIGCRVLGSPGGRSRRAGRTVAPGRRRGGHPHDTEEFETVGVGDHVANPARLPAAPPSSGSGSKETWTSTPEPARSAAAAPLARAVTRPGDPRCPPDRRTWPPACLVGLQLPDVATPTRWGRPRRTGVAAASCCRFSPTCRAEFRQQSDVRRRPLLGHRTSSTEPSERPAADVARAIRCCTAARFSASSLRRASDSAADGEESSVTATTTAAPLAAGGAVTTVREQVRGLGSTAACCFHPTPTSDSRWLTSAPDIDAGLPIGCRRPAGRAAAAASAALSVGTE